MFGIVRNRSFSLLKNEIKKSLKTVRGQAYKIIIDVLQEKLYDRAS